MEKEATAPVVQQLAELLAAKAPKAISIDELGHVYCYKHGDPIQHVLKSAGCDLSFAGFLKAQKKFTVDGDNVALMAPPGLTVPATAPPGPPGLVSDSLSRDLLLLLRPREVAQAPSSALRAAPCPSSPTSSEPALRAAPWRKESRAPTESPTSREPGLRSAPWRRQTPASAPPSVSEQTSDKAASETYLSLHNKVSGRSFNSRVVQIMNEVQGVFERCMFLNVDRVVRGGSVSRGTAIHGCADAEIVFVLKNVPEVSSGCWLPAVLRAVGSLVQSQLEEEKVQYFRDQDVRIVADCIKVQAADISVDVRFVRAFRSHKEVIASLAEQDFEERRHTAGALVQEKTQFVSKQPGQVKVTCRLLKWWRDQQEWTKPQARPSDDILESVAIYSGIMSKPMDQAAAMDNVMGALAHFDELRIVWTNFYSRGDVWAPLLKQRPLVMDPVNPFVNVADAQHFDPEELMAHARTSHFFH